ncbi:MAG TPA: LysM peptidoglycan-binding domain-containing protein [Kofleriaceae bacterium]|nr:LysM peptidoglycan-binding domain-containing protein [Kofleriaceae bacterium]
MIALRINLAVGGLTLALGAGSLLAQPAQTMPLPTDQLPAQPPAQATGVSNTPGGAPSAIYVPLQQPAPPTGSYHYDDLVNPPDEEPVVIHTGPTPELHVVRRGDTLWDICWYYFSDPWQWPKIWSYNGQITNPHWIYPGDLVRLLPRGTFVPPAPVTSLEPDATPTTTGPVPVPPSDGSELRIRQLAFLDQDALDASMVINGAVEDKTLLATGDDVYVSYPASHVPQVGSHFSIYAEDTPVIHGKAKIGSYVRVLGELEITSVKLDKHAQARIVASTGEIERGARVGPLQRLYKAVPPVANTVDLQRTIVARLTHTEIIGNGEVVFIDAGEADGVVPGNRMYVVRRGDALPGTDPTAMIGQDDRDFPARALGRVLLIDVGKHLSVGLVDEATQEMGVGDLVIMRREAAPGDPDSPPAP